MPASPTGSGLLRLDWGLGDYGGKMFCQLRAEDGRLIDLVLWNRRDGITCVSCGRDFRSHAYPHAALAKVLHDRGEGECEWKPRPFGLEVEVRFRGLVVIENGKHRTRAVARAAYRGTTVKPGRTVSKVRLYAMPLGSLLELARNGLPVVLVPRKRYAQGAVVIPASETARLAVAVDQALVAGDWAPQVDEKAFAPPGEQAQRTLDFAVDAAGKTS